MIRALLLCLALSGCTPLVCKYEDAEYCPPKREVASCTTDTDCVEKFGGTGNPDPAGAP